MFSIDEVKPFRDSLMDSVYVGRACEASSSTRYVELPGNDYNTQCHAVGWLGTQRLWGLRAVALMSRTWSDASATGNI